MQNKLVFPRLKRVPEKHSGLCVDREQRDYHVHERRGLRKQLRHCLKSESHTHAHYAVTKRCQVTMKNESILMKIFTILLLISCTVKAQENANPFTSLLTETKKNETLSPDAASLTNRPSPAFPVFTRIFNAFPPSASDGSLLSLLLDEDKIEGVGYGEALEKETVMHAAEDFVLDFKNPTTGGRITSTTHSSGAQPNLHFNFKMQCI